MTEQGDKAQAGWYGKLPVAWQSFVQLGFAGLAAIMLVMMYLDMSRESRVVREQVWIEAAANRAELREMSAAADRRNDAADRRNAEIAARIVDVTHELQRAVDVLRAAGLKFDKAVREMDEHGTAPAPRVKGPPG